MNVSFGSRRGESRLGGLIILALVGAVVYAVVRFAVGGRNADRPAAGADGKTQQQLKRERINQILDAEAPDLGPDPSRALVDGNLKTMKRNLEEKHPTTLQRNIWNKETNMKK